MNKKGDLRIWWIPQVPMNPFHMEVNSITEGKLLLETLAKYDLFQLENNIKPDFANAGGLEIYEGDDEGWCEWYFDGFDDKDAGSGIDDFTLEQLRNKNI